MKIPTEEQECRELVKWLQLRGICFTHVPLGGYRTKAEAGIFRAMGVSAGIPDYLIFDRPPNKKHYVGVALEMKRARPARSRITGDQRAWLKTLALRGWYCIVGYGCHEAIQDLMDLGY